MVQPVTTTDLLLQGISETLSEVRDLLQRQRDERGTSAGTAAGGPARKSAAKKAPAKSAKSSAARKS